MTSLLPQTQVEKIINVETAQQFYTELNAGYFEGKLPACKIEVSRRLSRTAGKIWPKLRLMRLSLSYHHRYGLEELRNTILHEMIHLWLYEQKLPSGHTPRFRAKLAEVGLTGRVTALPIPPRPYKYIYGCPGCQREISTRRKINSSCGRCDKVYNPRYKFKLLRELEKQGVA